MLMLQLKTPTRRIVKKMYKTLKLFMNSLIKQKQKILLQTKHQQDNVLVFLLLKDN